MPDVPWRSCESQRATEEFPWGYVPSSTVAIKEARVDAKTRS
jgi:hypothetical protein